MAAKVLVVDDEVSLVRLVQSYLEREGFEVSTAGDGETALALARDVQPDLVCASGLLPAILRTAPTSDKASGVSVAVDRSCTRPSPVSVS